MRDADKTRDQLLQELSDMRRKVSELEKIGLFGNTTGHTRMEDGLSSEYVGERLRSETDERGRVEKALRSSQDKLASILRAAPTGIGVVVQRIIIEVNEVLCTMTGYTRAELIGRSARMLYPTDEDFNFVGAEKYRQIADRGIGSVETRWRRKDAQILDILLSSAPINAADLSRGVTFTAVDITERKRAVNALRKSEAKFRSYIELSPLAIFVADQEGRLVQVNPSAAELLGHDTEALLRMRVWEMHPAEDRENVLLDFAALAREGRIDVEHRFRRRDGSLVWVSLHAVVIEGGLSLAYCWDITPRRQTEELLRRYELLFENSRDIILFIMRDNGKIFDANRAAENAYGYSREELLNLAIKDLRASGTIEPMAIQMAEADTRGILFETAHRRKDGSVFPVEVSSRGATISGVRALISIIRDITDRKRAEEALHESESKFRALAENSTAVIFLIQGENYVYINPAFTAITGYTFEDLSSMSFWDLISPDMQDLVRTRGIARQSKHDVPPRYDLKFITKSGEERYGNFGATLIEYQGKPAILGSVLDITERKSMEDAIREREKTVQAVLDAVHETIVLIDTKGTIILSNIVAAERLGTAVPELVGTCLYDHFSPDVAATRKEHYERVVGSAQPDFFEDTRSGRSFEHYCCPVFDEGGEVSGVTIFAHDITARNQAEKELQESEEKYRSIFENAVEGFYQTTPEGRFLSVNPALAEIMGFASPKEMTTTYTDIGIEHYVHHEDRTRFKTLLEKHGNVQAFEAQLQRKDGNSIWASLSGRAVRDAGGNVVYYEGTIENITERKRTTEALRESEEMYRTLIAASPDAITVTDPSGSITLISRKALELFEIPFENLAIGRSVLEWVTPGDQHKARVAMRQLLVMGETRSGEFVLKKDDGTFFDAEVHAAPIQSSGGMIRGGIFITRDITERNNLQAQLLQAQKMEAIGNLAGGVAHDFNNILMAMMGYTGLMETMIPHDHPLKSYVDQINQCTSKAANLTRGLLAFSRKQTIELKPQSTNAIVGDLEKLLRRLVPEDVELTLSLNEDSTIMADITQIDQVLMNLVSNAKDAMPGGGALRIETKAMEMGREFKQAHGFGEPGRYALISVTDTGIGMDETTQGKIFEPFFTTKEVGKGTGLGLSIVYGIIKQHGGYITVSSEPGRGTTFDIYLPTVKVKVSETRQPPLQAQGGTETLLLAEDNPDVRGVAKEILRISGYTVVEAKDGEDAVSKYREFRDSIDLLILDVVMPGMNGKDAYDEIRKLNPSVPVIFMSGYTGDVVLDKGIEDTTVDYISKPLSAHDLLKKVRDVLER